MSQINCECANWARDGSLPILSHHHRCEHYRPIPELVEIIQNLIKGIESWGSEEDGIYDGCWVAYEKAKIIVGQYDFIKDNVTPN